MTSVKDDAFYGWPYSYHGQHVDPRVMPQRPDMVARAAPPDSVLSSHVAPLGQLLYGNPPHSYRGGAFIGEQGSWDRSRFNGYKVVFVLFSGGHPDGTAQDAVTRFPPRQGRGEGPPVGIAVDKAGALLIADDVGNTVWSLTAAAPAS